MANNTSKTVLPPHGSNRRRTVFHPHGVPLLIENPVPQVITGTLTDGETLSLTAGEWLPSGVTFTYQWRRGGVAVTDATLPFYVLSSADIGFTISCVITGSYPTYPSLDVTTAETAAVRAAVPPSVAPTNNSLPVISGTYTTGNTLTVTPGSWTAYPAPAYSYQWYRSGTLVSGAIFTTYTLGPVDVGSTMTVTVTASNGVSPDGVATSARTPFITGAVTNSVPPQVTGTTTAGQTLSLSAGSWLPSGVTFTYQWRRSGVNVAGAVASTYPLTTLDIGKTMSCVVTGSLTNFTPLTITTAETPVVIAATTPNSAPTNTALPVITGSIFKVGSLLTVTPGTWSAVPAPTYTYQWRRDGTGGPSNIPGATGTSYTPVDADAGLGLSVTVTASNGVSPNGTATSLTTPAIAATAVGTFALGVNMAGPSISNFPVAIPNSAIDRVFALGVRRIRVPIALERFYPTPNAAYDAPYFTTYVEPLVSYCASKGMVCLVDFHCFGGYGNTGRGGTRSGRLGTAQGLTNAEFKDACKQLATALLPYKAFAWIDPCNEPNVDNGATIQEVIGYQTAAVAGIRESGFDNWIVVEGLHYSGAWNWRNRNPGFESIVLSDPLAKTMPSAHVYPDNNSSGGTTDGNGTTDYADGVAKGAAWTASGGDIVNGDVVFGGSNPYDTAGAQVGPQTIVKRLSVFFKWCREKNFYPHVGEMGLLVHDPNWVTMARNGLQYCLDNGAVIDLWSDGVIWTDEYLYGLQPARNGRQAKHWPLLQEFLGTNTVAYQPTVYYISGPTTGTPGVASSAFTVEYRGRIFGGAAVITPSDNGGGGTFSPATISLTGDNPTATFTYLNGSPKTVQISFTNNKSWTNPSAQVFTTETDVLGTNATARLSAVNIYSFYQRIATYYGPLIRLQRSSDNAQSDFSAAGLAYNSANVGRYLDVAAIAAWAGADTLTVVKWYDQSGKGNDRGPTTADGNYTRPTTSANWPTFVLNVANGKPVIRWTTGKRMDAYSTTQNVTGYTNIAGLNWTSGDDYATISYLGRINFGPICYQFYSPATGVQRYEEGGLTIPMVSGEMHAYAERWQAATTDGWSTYMDGVQVAKSTTVATTLSQDYGRSEITFGYNRIGNNALVADETEYWRFSSDIGDQLTQTISTNIATTFNTPAIVPNLVVDLDFTTATYKVNGSNVALATVVTTTCTQSANGLYIDSTHGNTNLIGTALSTVATGTCMVVMELQEANTNGRDFIRYRTGTTDVFKWWQSGNVAWISTGGGNTGFATSPTLNSPFVLAFNNGVAQRVLYNAPNQNYYSSASGSPNPLNTVDNILITATAAGNEWYLRKIKIYSQELPFKQFYDLSVIPLGTKGAAITQYYGVNHPRSYGQFYPAYDMNELDYWIGKGMKIIRLSDYNDQLQPVPLGPINGGGWTSLQLALRKLSAAGVYCLIDDHRYGARNIPASTLGTNGVLTGGTGHNLNDGTYTTAMFTDFWVKLYQAILADSQININYIVMGYQNEPIHGTQTTTEWMQTCSATTAALRAAGFTGWVTVPGKGNYTSLGGWVSSGNADAFIANYTDSANKTVVELHWYFDNGSAGANNTVNQYQGYTGPTAATRHARANGYKLMIGEMGGPNNYNAVGATNISQCHVELKNHLQHMKDNNDVWWGFTYWSAGMGWGNGYAYLMTPLLPASSGTSQWAGNATKGRQPGEGMLRKFAVG